MRSHCCNTLFTNFSSFPDNPGYVPYAIQCKRYNDTVPNDAVQAAFSAKNMFKKDIAVVMTNSYLSPHGMEEAESLNVKVWDREKLKKMISNPNDI